MLGGLRWEIFHILLTATQSLERFKQHNELGAPCSAWQTPAMTTNKQGDLICAAQFARLSLRGRADPDSLQQARSLAESSTPFWGAFLTLASEEKISPLLYDALRNQNIATAEVEQALYEEYTYTSRCNLLYFHELSLYLQRLASAGLQAIVLKGGVMAEVVYGNIALRPLLDLDMLLDPEQVPGALQILLSSGYTQDIEPHQGATLDYENEILLSKPGIEQVDIELHWSLFDSPFYQEVLPMDWFWDTAQPTSIGGATGLILGPEAQILHLCGHLSLHHSREPDLLWLNDIAEVIRYYENKIDWDLLLEKVQVCKLVLPIKKILPQVAGELGAPIPDDVLSGCLSLSASLEEAQVYAWHIDPERSVAQRIWSDIAYIPDWSRRLRYVLVKLIPSPSYMIPRYQIPFRVLLPFYYIYHLLIGFYSGVLLLVRR